MTDLIRFDVAMDWYPLNRFDGLIERRGVAIRSGGALRVTVSIFFPFVDELLESLNLSRSCSSSVL